MFNTFLLPENEMSLSLSSLLPFSADGVFGRCQKVPALDTDQYEVPPVVLQRLTATLQRLSHTGRLAWPKPCPGTGPGARAHLGGLVGDEELQGLTLPGVAMEKRGLGAGRLVHGRFRQELEEAPWAAAWRGTMVILSCFRGRAGSLFSAARRCPTLWLLSLQKTSLPPSTVIMQVFVT